MGLVTPFLVAGDGKEAVGLMGYEVFERIVMKDGGLAPDLPSPIWGRPPSKITVGDMITTMKSDEPMGKVLAQGLGSASLSPSFRAPYWFVQLQREGLIPPNIKIDDYVIYLRRHGLTDHEIFEALLYRRVRALRGTNVKLIVENAVAKEKLKEAKEEHERAKQTSDIIEGALKDRIDRLSRENSRLEKQLNDKDEENRGLRENLGFQRTMNDACTSAFAATNQKLSGLNRAIDQSRKDSVRFMMRRA